MKIKIKKFKHLEISYLEEQINSFLKKEGIKKIIYLSIQEQLFAVEHLRHIAFLIYEESE